MDSLIEFLQSQFPAPEVHSFDLRLLSGERNRYRNLIRRGFLHPSVDGQWALPDEKAMPYMTEKGFVTNASRLKEIIDVRTAGGKTRVEYTVIRTDITPFGKLMGFTEGDVVLHSAEHEGPCSAENMLANPTKKPHQLL